MLEASFIPNGEIIPLLQALPTKLLLAVGLLTSAPFDG